MAWPGSLEGGRSLGGAALLSGLGRMRLLALRVLLAISLAEGVHSAATHGDACGGVVPLSCAATASCAVQITQAVMRCSQSGGGTVHLAAGTYHLNDTGAAFGQFAPMLQLGGVHNVVLAGHPGAAYASSGYQQPNADPSATTLLIHGLRGGVLLQDSSGVTFSGLQVDMARMPYTYGRCTAATGSTMTVQFDSTAYPYDADSVTRNPWLMQVTDVNLFDTFNWRIGEGSTIAASLLHEDFFAVHLDAPGQLTLQGIGLSQGIVVGSDYLLRNTYYGAGGFRLSNCTCTDISNVTLWTVAGMGFMVAESSDTSLTDVAVTRRPGRPLSGCADASHFDETSGYIRMLRFRADGQGDDGLNVHGVYLLPPIIVRHQQTAEPAREREILSASK